MSVASQIYTCNHARKSRLFMILNTISFFSFFLKLKKKRENLREPVDEETMMEKKSNLQNLTNLTQPKPSA